MKCVECNDQKKQECKEELMKGIVAKSNEIMDGVLLTKAEWKMFYRLQIILCYYPDPQPQQVCNDEAEAITDLKEQHKYSIGELAFIFQRSKSTINAVLKQPKPKD